MRSGNGRHRRPRQAPALVVAAGVTGSAIALPLLAATGANAADANTWNQVAACESGGMWSADFGNGLYGGLQFSQATWEAYGGNEYAQRADLASRAQQIAVAEKVLAAKGPQAFANCGAGAGLTKGGGSADVDPGVPDTSDNTPPPVPTAPATGTPDAAATPGTPATGTPAPGATPPSGTPKSPTPSASTPASPGKHRGTPAPEESAGTTPGTTGTDAPAGTGTDDPAGRTDPKGQDGASGSSNSGNSSDSRDSGQHASRGDGASREVGNTPAANGGYTVRPGDNLSAIAEANRVQGGWPALYRANEQLIGTDPNLILPGQSLELKDAAGAATTPNSVPKQG
ncbi:transglycosylase family protein [Streptomyces sp. NPDC001828]|uniref:transglycosylase family protein n=1 Tax=Streptomyces sp. NPDC001828 TaxID=3364615 RepID=UPI0036B462E8